MGIDCGETFPPTANLTHIRVLLQKVAQENLLRHQMDVKTAYLHAPIGYEVYINQPEGYEKGEGLVCRLQKSLYRLKQSGRKWNRILHEYLTTVSGKTQQTTGKERLHVCGSVSIFPVKMRSVWGWDEPFDLGSL